MKTLHGHISRDADGSAHANVVPTNVARVMVEQVPTNIVRFFLQLQQNRRRSLHVGWDDWVAKSWTLGNNGTAASYGSRKHRN